MLTSIKLNRWKNTHDDKQVFLALVGALSHYTCRTSTSQDNGNCAGVRLGNGNVRMSEREYQQKQQLFARRFYTARLCAKAWATMIRVVLSPKPNRRQFGRVTVREIGWRKILPELDALTLSSVAWLLGHLAAGRTTIVASQENRRRWFSHGMDGLLRRHARLFVHATAEISDNLTNPKLTDLRKERTTSRSAFKNTAKTASGSLSTPCCR